jgi:hypothetical protein
VAGQEPNQATANDVLMSELGAQRTLVKSPPELWSEFSDPAVRIAFGWDRDYPPGT